MSMNRHSSKRTQFSPNNAHNRHLYRCKVKKDDFCLRIRISKDLFYKNSISGPEEMFRTSSHQNLSPNTLAISKSNYLRSRAKRGHLNVYELSCRRRKTTKSRNSKSNFITQLKHNKSTNHQPLEKSHIFVTKICYRTPKNSNENERKTVWQLKLRSGKITSRTSQTLLPFHPKNSDKIKRQLGARKFSNQQKSLKSTNKSNELLDRFSPKKPRKPIDFCVSKKVEESRHSTKHYRHSPKKCVKSQCIVWQIPAQDPPLLVPSSKEEETSDTDSTKDTPSDPLVQVPKLQKFRNISEINLKTRNVLFQTHEKTKECSESDRDDSISNNFVPFDFEQSNNHKNVPESLNITDSEAFNSVCDELNFKNIEDCEGYTDRDSEFGLRLHQCLHRKEDPSESDHENTKQEYSLLDRIKNLNFQLF
ncbi:unnamed protein product [Moneuplotes crassus]|uniref:Uncharacterized protein n=1 Tax=Euplotes crassus TaxID=5936 RepID=A0AAD1XD50_EUPCR|nr:unnamed protein product [Moneuplotes crassus]